MKELLRLPIDQYERYRLVADLADRLRRGDRPLRVLDIGGRTGLMADFLPADEVVRVDREPSDRPARLVLGDGARLPFADGSFDLVTACDTLEHVPPEDRRAFVTECARVSAGHVVLVGPFASSRVRDAEARLREFLRVKLDLDHRYLNEHAAHGLPRRREVRGWFEALGAATLEVGHGNLQRWLGLMCLEILLESDPDLQRFAPSFYEFYNAGCYSTDDRGPVYRHAVVAALDGAPLPDLEGLFSESVAPPELFDALMRFAPDLAVFDRARATWAEERERFRATVEELERLLAAERQERERLRSLREGDLDDREALARRAREAEAQCAALDSARHALEQALERERHERAHELERARQQVEVERAARTALEAALHRAEEAREASAASFGHRLALTDQARAAAEARLHRLEQLGGGEVEVLRARLDALEQQLAAARSWVAAEHAERGTLRTLVEELTRERNDLRRRLAALERRFERLRRATTGTAGAAPATANRASGPDPRRNRARGRRRGRTHDRRGRR